MPARVAGGSGPADLLERQVGDDQARDPGAGGASAKGSARAQDEVGVAHEHDREPLDERRPTLDHGRRGVAPAPAPGAGGVDRPGRRPAGRRTGRRARRGRRRCRRRPRRSPRRRRGRGTRPSGRASAPRACPAGKAAAIRSTPGSRRRPARATTSARSLSPRPRGRSGRARRRACASAQAIACDGLERGDDALERAPRAGTAASASSSVTAT